MDYQMLNSTTSKDYFPLSFIDQMHKYILETILLHPQWKLRIQAYTNILMGTRENNIHLPIRHLCISLDLYSNIYLEHSK